MPLTKREEELLALLNRYLAHLQEMQPRDVKELEPFGPEDAAVQRWLQLAVQCCVDLGDSMAPRFGIPEPPRMRDIFQALARAGIIEASLVGPLESLTDFRNRLAHAYSSLTPAETWRRLNDGLPVLQAFSQAVAQQR